MAYNFESDLEELTEIRHHIHSIAEVSGKEDNTANFIKKKLDDCNPDALITGMGGHGILARFGTSNDGPRILIRCELDALPIAEENDLDYLSGNEDVGHKCGHDGHMAILCGVAKWLSQQDSLPGEVMLLFQPAEETGKGAEKVLEDKKFKDIKPDYVFALHNIPGYEKSEIIIKKGAFAAGSVGFKAALIGATAHAAHPEEGRSPAQAVAQLIQTLSAGPQFYVPMGKAAKITIVQAHLGGQGFGISPGRAELGATLRADENKLLDQLKERVLNLAKGIATTYNLDLQTAWKEPFPVTNNNADCVELLRLVASKNDLNFTEKETPFGWSEDFGRFTDKFTGAMFGLGSGKDQPALHSADYDFPDEIIPAGVKMFTGIIEAVDSKQ